MDATSSPFVSSRRMGVYDPIHQISTWEENFKSNDTNNLTVSTSIIGEVEMKLDNQVHVQVSLPNFIYCLLQRIMPIFPTN